MFYLSKYLDDLIEACTLKFGDRLLYVGLQGSYLRGEQHDNSDIDIMIVIDNFTVPDMNEYRAVLKSIGYFEKSCGFICSKDELAHWNPLEVCQLLNTTKDLYGQLKELLPPASRKDEINYVKLSLGNFYHEICHRYIHADKKSNMTKFRQTCKYTFFLIQNLHYLESGKFITTKQELKENVSKADREILELAELDDNFDFDRSFAALFVWCQSTFIRVGNIS